MAAPAIVALIARSGIGAAVKKYGRQAVQKIMSAEKKVSGKVGSKKPLRDAQSKMKPTDKRVTGVRGKSKAASTRRANANRAANAKTAADASRANVRSGRNRIMTGASVAASAPVANKAANKPAPKKPAPKKPAAKKPATKPKAKPYNPSAVAAGYKPGKKKKVKSGDLMAASSGKLKTPSTKPKKKTAFGSGSAKTITRNGKQLANVSKEQLSRSGLSLRGYMNAWNKTGKRPTAKKPVKSKTSGPIKSTPKKLKQLKRKN